MRPAALADIYPRTIKFQAPLEDNDYSVNNAEAILDSTDKELLHQQRKMSCICFYGFFATQRMDMLWICHIRK